MKQIFYIVGFLILAGLGRLTAQQDPNYTFYRYNMNLINPAWAGSGEGANLGINVRSQWASVQGAPETQSLIFGTPVGKNVGMGVSVTNDKTFVEKQLSLALDISYRLTMNEATSLFLGLKGGFTSYDVNTDGLITYDIMADPNLINIDGRFNPNFGAGLYLRNKSYFLSLSVPKILTPDRLEQNDGQARLGVDKVHAYLAGGYEFPLGADLALTPTFLMRYVDASPLSLDLTAQLEYRGAYSLGTAYRLDESVSLFFVFKTLNFLELGYAYEIALESSVRNIDNGTHEVMMNLKF